MKLIKSITGTVMVISGGLLALIMIGVFVKNTFQAFGSDEVVGYKIGTTIGGLIAVFIFGIIPFFLIRFGIKLITSRSNDHDLPLDRHL